MDDLLDKLLANQPEIPFMGGEAGKRGFVMCLNEDGTFNRKKTRQYFKEKAKYEAQFNRWRSYWVMAGKWLRGEAF